jgi:cytochrome c553
VPILELKSYISLPFLAVGVITVLFAFALMGRPAEQHDPKVLKRRHRISGYVFIVLLVVLSYLCLSYVVAVGSNMPVRALFHGILAVGLIGVLVVKMLIVRFYRGLVRMVPALGVVAFILAFVVFFTSAGYFFLREAHSHAAGEGSVAEVTLPPAVARTSGDPAAGQATFAEDCAACHAVASEEWRIGPGLKRVLARDTLPESGRPATPGNVWSQIVNPVGVMPAFDMYSDQEMADLLAYIKTL